MTQLDRRAVQRRLLLGGAIALVLLVAVFLFAPRSQPQAYHSFADTNPLLGVPNALNVLSNAAFLLAGAG